MNDQTWLLLFVLILFYDPLKGGITVENLRKHIEDTIEKKLSSEDISAAEIHELAMAYSELTKNDWLKEAYNKLGSGLFNNSSAPNENAIGNFSNVLTNAGEIKPEERTVI